jgi:hypothetical protein
MAFCTQCGANLAGAFCTKCGARSAATAAAVPPPVPPARTTGTSPIKIVFIVLLCVFGFAVVSALSTGAYVAHRMRRAGLDREMFRRDPARAVARMLAATYPDLEVVDSDRNTVTVRNRHTGNRVTWSFDDVRNGRLRLEAVDDNGHAGSIEVGGDSKPPSWVPEYPGSNPEPLFAARGEGEHGAGEAGAFHFDTPDSASQVMSFYEEHAREMDLEVHTVRVGETVTLATADDEHERVLKVIATREGDRTTVTVSYGRKR